jgi:hypothetical protein
MREDNKVRYRLIKAGEHGQSIFVDITDEAAVEAVRHQFGNRNLLISTGYYTAADASAPRIYPLRVHIACRDLEQARISTLGAGYYINGLFCIPLDCLEIILTRVGDIVGLTAVGSNYADRNGGNNRGLANTGRQGDGKGSIYITAGNTINNTSAGDSSRITGTDVTSTATATEMIITVPPIVLGQPTALMPAINYQLARKMAEDGVPSIDVDVYEQNHFIPLPNSLRGSRYVIHLTVKELLSLDATGISELAKNPRPEDSLIMPRFIPEAAERFAGTCAEFEKKHCQQDKLRALILKNWQIPPCIRRLSWADLETNTALEACRVISGFFSFIHARNDEIWYHVLRLARRNSIQDIRGHQKLRAIIAFALENPLPPECSHPLVRQFCPAGGCFMTELIEECENPLLFELRGKQK